MDKISFLRADSDESVDFFVLEQTRINGIDYLLVTDSEEEDGEAYILKDLSQDGQTDAEYEFVEDDNELEAIGKVFQEMLEDIDLV